MPPASDDESPGSPSGSRGLRPSAPVFSPALSPASQRARQPCSFFRQGNCRFGEGCWFSHDIAAVVSPFDRVDGSKHSLEASVIDESPSSPDGGFDCCICFDQPSLYGLLEHCSHVFCAGCINQWRSIEGKSSEQILSGALSACPICRVPSTFVCQSSIFHPAGTDKQFAIAQMKAKLSQIDCKHFKPTNLSRRPCPFGSDCLFRHVRADGTPQRLNYTRQQYLETMHRPRTVEEDWLLDILTQAASGRDAADILRRFTGRWGPVNRSSVYRVVHSLQQMGLGQDAGDEDDWIDDDDDDEDDDESLLDEEDSEGENFAESDDDRSNVDSDSASTQRRPVRPLPQRSRRPSSHSSGAPPVVEAIERDDRFSVVPREVRRPLTPWATRERNEGVLVPLSDSDDDDDDSNGFEDISAVEDASSVYDDETGVPGLEYEDDTNLSTTILPEPYRGLE